MQCFDSTQSRPPTFPLMIRGRVQHKNRTDQTSQVSCCRYCCCCAARPRRRQWLIRTWGWIFAIGGVLWLCSMQRMLRQLGEHDGSESHGKWMDESVQVGEMQHDDGSPSALSSASSELSDFSELSRAQQLHQHGEASVTPGSTNGHSDKYTSNLTSHLFFPTDDGGKIPLQNREDIDDDLCSKELLPLQQISLPQFRQMRVIVNETAVLLPNGTKVTQAEYSRLQSIEYPSSKIAACEYIKNPRKRHTNHYPHALQQLYRCFSYWNQYPDKEWVLVWPPDPARWDTSNSDKPKYQFSGTDGFLHILKEVFHVRFVTSAAEVNYQTVRPRIGNLWITKKVKRLDWVDFNMNDPRDAQALGDAVRKHYGLTLTAGCPTTQSHVLGANKESQSHPAPMPKIAILNRRPGPGRNLRNDISLSQYLMREIPELKQRQDGIPIMYFEDRDLTEQIEFYSSYDIVISPHGAQLTALPFLPPHGGILEIFPVGYLSPHYFGSLAIAAGINYGYVYMTDGDMEKEVNIGLRFRPVRARARNVCPKRDVVKDSVMAMIDQWRQSCALSVGVTPPKHPYPESGRDPTQAEWEQLEELLKKELEYEYGRTASSGGGVGGGGG